MSDGSKDEGRGAPSGDVELRVITSPGAPTPEARARIDRLKQDPLIHAMVADWNHYYPTTLPDGGMDMIIADSDYEGRGGKPQHAAGLVYAAWYELIVAGRMA